MDDKEKIILPEKYYLHYFQYLLDFVKRHYAHILDTLEELFYSDFDLLSEDAKCLYIRMINRKGIFFQLDKMEYPEITDLETASEELVFNRFTAINESKDLSQFQIFTKGELLSLFAFLDRNQRKDKMLEELSEADIPTLHRSHTVIELRRFEVVDFLTLLFFGNHYQKMTEFVIRDVGHIKLKSLDESKFKPWFKSRAEALSVMHLSQLKPVIRELMKADILEFSFLEEIPWHKWLAYRRSKDIAEKLLLEVATYFEKKDYREEALQSYQMVERPPARERQIRIHIKEKNKKAPIEIAQKIVESPFNAAELTFAKDYLNKTGVRINRSMTQKLKDAASIQIEKNHMKVESGTLQYFEEKGWEGIHSENFIWKALFGLTFWEELFDEGYEAFHHPLQRKPSDLGGLQFFQEREIALNKRIQSFRTRKVYFKYISTIYNQNQGNANQFVYWHENLLYYLEKMIHYLPLKGLKQTMLELARQTKENSTGFPDLFIWRNTEYQFYEIKSPNDHLSAQQLFWINFFAKAGIKAAILRVNYL